MYQCGAPLDPWREPPEVFKTLNNQKSPDEAAIDAAEGCLTRSILSSNTATAMTACTTSRCGSHQKRTGSRSSILAIEVRKISVVPPPIVSPRAWSHIA